MAGEDQPSLDHLAFPRQQVSPARAAGIYLANIPIEIYTYPYHGVLEGRDAPHDGIGSDRGKGGHQAVTMVQYEPGSMVDCHV